MQDLTYLGKANALRLNGSNCLSTSMQESFSHRRFVDTFSTPYPVVNVCIRLSSHWGLLTIQAEVRSLECHLNKSIRTESVARDEVLSITLELEGLTVILANEITDPCFSKSDARTKFGCEFPLKLLWGRIDSFQRWRWWF